MKTCVAHHAPSLVLWLNGAHGVGKSSVAKALLRLRPDALLFDPEKLGRAIQRNWPVPVDDFKTLPAWRAATTTALLALVRDRAQLDAILGALRDGGCAVAHVTLTAGDAVRRSRLRWRLDLPHSRAWARRHSEGAAEQLAGPLFAVHVPTDSRKPGEIAAALLAGSGPIDADRI